LKNIVYFKFELNDEIENTSFFFTKDQRKLEIKRIRTQLKKNNIWQIRIERWNWKQIKFLQKDQEQKSEVKRIRIEVEIPTTKMTNL
jgi:hypothetical protein